MKDPKSWLACYLYCAEDSWNKLLPHHVLPLVQEILKNKWADQFFFIRYWEKGPHIRLRFKGDTKLLEQKIRPYLTDFFKNYFEKNPSKRVDPPWMQELPENQKWFGNDSIQYIEYEPEIERYGGTTGIIIAEKEFEASSKATLAVMKESSEWNYDRALGVAIQMHLGFAAALKMSLEELDHFCSLIYRSWFPRAYPYQPNRTEEERKKITDIILKAFAENYSKQRSMLVPYHQTIWNALQNNVEFEQDWFNEWVINIKKIDSELSAAHKEKKLEYPRWQEVNEKINIPDAHQLRWPILESYVHMTNNRLGIQNRDEAYLGYIIMNSIKEIMA